MLLKTTDALADRVRIELLWHRDQLFRRDRSKKLSPPALDTSHFAQLYIFRASANDSA